ncbi:TPA: site-specific integrase [Mannheimia haemolytica]|nr:site-specific integrase [Mannheimia haemolytica]HDL6026573.1 site-specific integrase [Mannheimia haemolytica]
MASIRKRGSKYQVEISKKGVRKSATFRTKAEAQAWAYEEERKIEIISKGGVVDILFAEALERYQNEVSINKRTWRREIGRINNILKEPIANRYVQDIKRDDIEDWIEARLKRGLKGSSVERDLSILSNVFTYCLKRWGYISENPMIGVIHPNKVPPRKQRYSQEDIDKILEVSKYREDIKRSNAQLAAAMLFAIETAMRAGEISGLTWDNVNFEKRIAHLPMTKNGSSRDVPLSSKAIEILKRLETIKKDNSVFQLPQGNGLSARFFELKEKAGLSYLNFHDTRREALSRLAKKVDVMTLAKISGHKDVKILLNTYYAPNMEEVAHLLD